MKKPSSYILLPTEKEIKSGDLVKLPNGELKIMSERDMLDYLDSQSSATKHQYIYILSSDRPKEGDKVIVERLAIDEVATVKRVEKAGRYQIILTFESGSEYGVNEKSILGKILATTNPELNRFEGFEMESGELLNDIVKISPSDIPYIISLYNGKGNMINVVKLAKDMTDKKGYGKEDELFEAEDGSEYQQGIEDGYNRCLSDNAGKRFSEEDMRKLAFKVANNCTLGEIDDFIKSCSKEQSKRDTILVEYEEKMVTDFSGNSSGGAVNIQPKLKDGCIVISRD